VVRQPVEQRRGQPGVAQDGGPFGEAQVGRNDEAGALAELAHAVEQERRATSMPGTKHAQSVVSWRSFSGWPVMPKITFWCTRPRKVSFSLKVF